MSSVYARNLARYFAASQMERMSRPATPTVPDYVEEGINAWNLHMLWLIPFVQASGYRIVIENPKSHEKIVIDKDTKAFPYLSSSWLLRYDKQDLEAWMAKEKKMEEARRIAEKRGRAKYGNSYKPSEQEVKEILSEL